MVELDVRMTRDFFLVVHHDQDIRRTSNGEGNVWDYTLQELRAFDAGVWFGPKFKGERIPTLRQVMELLPSHVTLNIEMKTDGEPRPKKQIALEEACILAIMEKKLESRTIVSSFDHAYLKRFHHLYPSIKTGVLYLPAENAGSSPSVLVKQLGASAFICSKSQLTHAFVQDAHEHDIPVGCYTINSPEELGAALKLDVDAVITNFPGKMRKVLQG